MAYQVLYRKWRPLVFDDVIGQRHVVSTLKNEITNNRIAHAYLFCGTRGTGKTSVAKIFSRAINCLDNRDGNPCNECDVCKGILSGSIMDVEEMDAASNNGVDNIRDIREKVIYSTAYTKYKVFIIDEVHMLSTDAFNALLKTLEEPPEHVIFILATTEYHKIPITILSRCQCFDFKRITVNDTIERLRYIAEQDGIRLTEDGLDLVAQLGDGSMRDALSILEQCIASCGKDISYEDIVKVLGISDFKSVYDVASAIADLDAGHALDIFSGVIAGGKNAYNFIEMLLGHMRDIMICKLTKEPQTILNTTQDKLESIKRQSGKFSESKLNFVIETLAKALNEAKWSPMPQTSFELALVKCASPELDTTMEALLERIKYLEDRINSGVSVVAGATPVKSSALQQPRPNTEATPVKPKADKPEEEPVRARETDSRTEPKEERASEPQKTKAGGAQASALCVDRWNDILDFIKSSGELPTFAYISQARPKVESGGVLLVFPDHAAINKTIIERPASMEIVKNAVKKVIRSDIPIKCCLEKEVSDQSNEINPLDKLKQLGDKFPEIINIIED